MIARPLLIALLALALLSCASTVPVATSAADAQAKQFAVPAGKSMIYVVRSPGQFGSAMLFQVALDGKMVGGIATKTYFALPVEPGEHIVSASSNENQDQVTLTTEPDKVYFVRVNAKFGMVSARVDVEQTTEAIGRDFIQRSRLAAGVSPEKQVAPGA